MNFVYLSPNFPPNYYQFCVHLNQLGVNVLGLADEPFNFLRDELKDSLSEYYWVNDMHNYAELLRALGYFTSHYGKIDRIDSHNEYRLETEARLRTDSNIFGIKNYEIDRIKRKSQMKKVFVKAGVQVARGRVVRERFFHFEFFRNEDNRIVVLEVNIRPPGGMTTDMFNFANDIDIYKEQANVVVHNKSTTDYNRKYHCCYIGRKFNRNYVYSHDQVVAAFRNELVHHEKISGVFSVALGDYGYLVRSPELDMVHQMAAYIHKTIQSRGSGSNNNEQRIS